MPTATEVQVQLQHQVQQIRARRDYTSEAKRALIARAYREHRQEMDALRTRARRDVSHERARLSRQLFGVDALVSSADSRVSLAVSYRDAQDRVARLSTEDEAVELLARAERGGDEVLARAIIERSVAEVWLNPLNAYVVAHPSTEPNLQRLIDMETSTSNELGWEMQHVLDKPAEIAGSSDVEIDRLASSPVVAGIAA